MITLKEAIKNRKLNQFIKERKETTGDKKAFDKAISSMLKGKSPKVQEASSQEKDES
jgi:hypothetical protein